MTDDLYDHYASTVSSVARKIGSTYLGYTTLPDIEQELWCVIYANVDHFTAYKDAPALAYTALKRGAHTYCEKQRTASLGLPQEAAELYSPRAVRELLMDCFDHEDWQSFSSAGDSQPRAKKLEATSDRIAMLIDVKMAVDQLGERDYSIVIGRFKYRYDDDQMAEMLEIAQTSVGKTVSRAVQALTDLLNPTPAGREYVERRKVKSNAAARAELDNSW